MQIFNFVVLSVIISPYNVLTPHINHKTHLPNILPNVRGLEKKEIPLILPLGWGGSPTLPADP